jgi:hypothetical protein
MEDYMPNIKKHSNTDADEEVGDVSPKEFKRSKAEVKNEKDSDSDEGEEEEEEEVDGEP